MSLSQIVVDDGPLKPSDVLVSAPLVGYRAFPKSGIVSLDHDKIWAVKGNVFYDAAVADTDFQHQIGKSASQIRSMPLNELVELYQKAAKVKCGVNSKQKNSPDCPGNLATATAVKAAYSDNSNLDATIVRRAFESGAFEKPSVSYLQFGGGQDASAMGVVVDPTFAKVATSIYSSADKFSASGQNPSAAFDFGDATKVAVRNKPVSGTTAVILDTVDIGKPLILTAADEKLQVPASILNQFDIYWIQLALNPQEDLQGKYDELSFFVSLQTVNSEALELVPIRYGEEQDVKSTTGIPSGKVEAGGVGIEIGQIYGREVTYKTLKPTIVGTGIQAAKFGWTLSKEMLDMSAKRLIAIVGVPKRSTELNFDMVVSAKTNPGLFVQGNVASSATQKFSTSLRTLH